MSKGCTVCGKLVRARGFCITHYLRARASGEIIMRPKLTEEQVEARDDRIAELLLAGKSDAEIQQETGLTEAQLMAALYASGLRQEVQSILNSSNQTKARQWYARKVLAC